MRIDLEVLKSVDHIMTTSDSDSECKQQLWNQTLDRFSSVWMDGQTEPGEQTDLRIFVLLNVLEGAHHLASSVLCDTLHSRGELELDAWRDNQRMSIDLEVFSSFDFIITTSTSDSVRV